MALEGRSKVHSTNVKTGEEFEASAKVENAGRKFSDTAVETMRVDGNDVIQEIDLAGTRTNVEVRLAARGAAGHQSGVPTSAG